MFGGFIAIRSVFLVLLVSSSVCATDNKPAVVDDQAYTHAQRLVDIDHGRRLNLYCVGKGSPTVVFDAGLGG